MTGLDCGVLFGSSNDTSTLRVFQPDSRGTAMARPPSSATDTLVAGSRFWDVDMVDASRGWAVGDGSAANGICVTNDGGLTWTPVASLLTGAARGVDAPSTNVVWVVRADNSQVVRSLDAGATWSTSDVPGTSPRLMSIMADDANTAWALGSDRIAGQDQARIWRTTDGGTSWNVVWSIATNNTRVVAGTSLTGTLAWAVDSTGSILRTNDGTTFTQQGTTGDWNTQDLDALDANRIAVATDAGFVRITTDGGSTWSSPRPPERTQLNSVTWSPDGSLWVSGYNGSIQRSADNGSTWNVVAQPHEPATIVGISSPAAGHVVGVSFGRAAVRTVDGGTTWSRFGGDAGVYNWRSIDGVDGSRLWRVGSAGAIATSTDGGSSWTAQASPTSNAMFDVVAIDRQVAIAAGAGGTIIRTSDSGTNWTTVASGTTQRLRTVAAAPDGRTLYAAGDAGTLLRSIDVGVTWTSVGSGVTTPIWSIAAWSATSVLIGTSDDVVRTSTDAGATWTTHTLPAAANEAIAAAVAVPGTTTAYLLWDDNIITSTNATSVGATWTDAETPGYGQATDLDLAGTDVLWMSGGNGRLERGTGGGSSWTALTGISYFRFVTGVVALGEDAAVASTQMNTNLYSNQPLTIPDYSGTQWGTMGGLFGICLKDAPGADTTWPTTGSCPQSDGTNWRAIPLNGGLAASRAAERLTPGTTTATFRFGVSVPSTQAPGSYRAPLTFELVAPAG